MAGALELKRETIRLRREQAKRNAEAVAEAQARRDEMLSRPSDRHRRRPQPQTGLLRREGHRMIYETAPASLDDIAFASAVAKELAEEAQLSGAAFLGHAASSEKGYTKADVVAILEDEEEIDEDDDGDEDGEKMAGEYEDKMDRGGENK